MNSLKYHIENYMYSNHPVGLICNPFFLARSALFCAVKQCASDFTGKILDIGCGTKPYQFLFTKTENYIGIEIDTTENRIRNIADNYYDGNKLPYADSTFDGVIYNQVLEHIFEPHCFLNEVNRVLKSGGHFLLTVPFVWDEHEQPYDYARYSSFGLVHLLQKSGFIIKSHRKTRNDASIIFQLMNAYIHKQVAGHHKALQLFFTVSLCFPANIIGLVSSHILPGNNDLYLDNVIVAVSR